MNYKIENDKQEVLTMAIGSDQGVQPYKFGGKELDMQHGLNLYDFSARTYDPAVGRFTTMDPLAEKYYSISPYAYCANNPVNAIDPDGRDSYYTNAGRFIYTDNKKTDEIRIINNYLGQLIDMAKSSSGKIDVGKVIKDGKFESVGIGNADLSAKAYSNIFTDVLSKMDDVNMKELFNGKVSTAVFDGNSDQPTLTDNYNTNINTYDETASHQGVNGKSLVTGNIVVGGKKDNRFLYSTVSNVQNMLGAHELLGHGMNNWGDRSNNHYKVYEFQMAHPTWRNATPQYKNFMNAMYQRYLNPKR
jgi:RHS repeat-associated protein